MEQHSFERVIRKAEAKEGLKYKDVAPLLLEKVPAEWHKIKPLGYDKQLQCKTYYAYIPWGKIRDRIIELVGSDGYSFEITSQYIDGEGDPIMMGVLNILGVEHQGIGYGRSDERYSGGKLEIAWSDCFKNAAKLHGLGAYLDDQEEVCRYLIKSASQNAITLGRLLAIQFQKAGKEVVSELRVTPPVSVSPSVQIPPASVSPSAQIPSVQIPPVARPGQNPEQAEIMKKLREKLGLTQEEVLAHTKKVHPAKLSPEEFKDAMIAIAAKSTVGSKFPTFGNAQAACSISVEAALRQGTPLDQAIYLWFDQLKVLTP